MTPSRAAGAVALVATVVQVALWWGGTFALVAISLLVVAGREAADK